MQQKGQGKKSAAKPASKAKAAKAVSAKPRAKATRATKAKSSKKQPTPPKQSTKRGRPTLFSAEVRDRICELVANGATWKKIAGMPGMPTQTTLSRWLHDYAEFRKHYACARAARAEDMVAQIEELIEKLNDPSDGTQVMAIAQQIQAFKWLCSHFYPKMYSEKMHIEHEVHEQSRRYDYSRATDAELATLRTILEKCLIRED